MDIVKQLRQPINEKEDYFISQWPNEEPNVHDAVRFNAAKEIERLREALKRIGEGDQCTVLLVHPTICKRAYEARAALKEGE